LVRIVNEAIRVIGRWVPKRCETLRLLRDLDHCSSTLFIEYPQMKSLFNLVHSKMLEYNSSYTQSIICISNKWNKLHLKYCIEY
jgi:hypothetical protein